eukprot:CAMPEP_0184077374 /NCGR_PEP_ID=MMETSP0974-20121125/623_1 /TAXON_ID=483370 /ORGANISM="non described non described, Strain CCMP2097" /LENGTH=119 /DNA_ID=CAMNT_0026379947 /DNA_START=600 /DNA_END=958 /DNA_ORIENTATION=-
MCAVSESNGMAFFASSGWHFLGQKTRATCAALSDNSASRAWHLDSAAVQDSKRVLVASRPREGRCAEAGPRIGVKERLRELPHPVPTQHVLLQLGQRPRPVESKPLETALLRLEEQAVD